MSNISKLLVRRSARLADRFPPGGAAVREARDVPVVESRVRSCARLETASASSRAPRQAVPERVRDVTRLCAQSQGCGLRAVRIALTRCDSSSSSSSSVWSSPAVLDREEIRNKTHNTALVSAIRPAISSAFSSANSCANKPAIGNKIRYANVPRSQPHNVCEPGSSLRPLQQAPANCVPSPSLASTGVRILQLNMRRSAVVTGEVRQLIAEKRLDVLLLQELHVKKHGKSHTFVGLGKNMRVAAVRSQRPWAAVAVCNPQFQMVFVSQLSTTHCVCVEVLAPSFSFYVVSCYFQHSDEIEKHLRHLETVLHSLRGKRLIVAVDANARSSLWGSQETDEKGSKFEDLIRAHGMDVVNDAGQEPTFWTARGSSFIDVTLASPSMSQFIGEWKVRCDWTSSDHNSIDIRLRVPREKGVGDTANTRFDTRRADWERFSESLADLSRSKLEVLDLMSVEDVENMAETLATVLSEACAASMPKKRRFRKSNPWWTVELTISKKKLYRLKRALQKGQDEPLRQKMLLEYRSSLRQHSRMVKKVKLASWQEYVTSHGNSEPWGFVYKQQAEKLRVESVLSTLRRSKTLSTISLEETASYLLDVHVPNDRIAEDTPRQSTLRENVLVAPDTADASFFTEAEMVKASKTFKNDKAPGPDLIEVRVLKAAIRVIPGQITKLFNGCLQWGVFPSAWKVGSLRVLLKGEDKDEKDPKSYRPICLLSVVGKLFEKLIKLRLTDTSLAPGRVSDRQFGFIAGRSTEDAVVELRRMVSASEKRYAVALLFDISGAFDNVWWPLVLDALKSRDCPRNVFGVLQSYFDNRRVKLPIGSSEVSKRATRGCPQGSVLGPACWNLMFDDLLKLLEGSNIPFAAYADDLAVIINGNSRKDIEVEGQRAVDLITEWCKFAKLQVSERKTEAIVLKSDVIMRNPIGRRGGDRPDRKRKNNKRSVDFASRPPTIKINSAKIRFRETVRYLGVHIDRFMKVRSHCQKLSSKTGLLFGKLGRLARAVWGLKYKTLSIIYRGVFQPCVTYAAAGWVDLCTESDIRILRAAQRKALISVTGAYRTASWESLCVVAGTTPVDILLKEFAARYKARKGLTAEIGNIEIPAELDKKESFERIREEAINMWQTRWSSSIKGRTTFAFFKDIRQRLATRSLETNHWSTQALTGHGDFRARLESLGLVDSDVCVCGSGIDTVQHFLLDCPLFDAQREALRELVPQSEWRWPEAAHFFVSSSEAYAAFADFCSESLWLKGFES